MRPLTRKLKPTSGYSWTVQLAVLLALPFVLLLLVRADFTPFAFLLVVLSKWRTLAVRPRFWLANIRANSIDLVVGLSSVVFLMQTSALGWQIIWAVVYAAWLIYLKPRSGVLFGALQAGVGFVMSMTALYLAWGGGPLIGLVLITGALCYIAARHFFAGFDEPYMQLLSYLWAYFGAAMAWVLGHWLLFYGVIAQPTVLLGVLGLGLASIYYLDHFDKLSTLLRRQFVFIMVAVVVVVLAVSNWGNTIG
jgi:hypothetical protein